MPRAAKPAVPPERGDDTPQAARLPEPRLHVFANHSALIYTESRDAAGAIIGRVEPGDARTLTAAPDERWRPATAAERRAAPPVPASEPEPPAGNPGDESTPPAASDSESPEDAPAAS